MMNADTGAIQTKNLGKWMLDVAVLIGASDCVGGKLAERTRQC